MSMLPANINDDKGNRFTVHLLLNMLYRNVKEISHGVKDTNVLPRKYNMISTCLMTLAYSPYKFQTKYQDFVNLSNDIKIYDWNDALDNISKVENDYRNSYLSKDRFREVLDKIKVFSQMIIKKSLEAL